MAEQMPLIGWFNGIPNNRQWNAAVGFHLRTNSLLVFQQESICDNDRRGWENLNIFI